MVHSSNESQQTQTFSVDHENVLPDHYRLIELIGRGGMAEVYLAEDRRLGRKVAIKFLNPEFRRDPDRVRRFRQEARSASALNHPNILIIHDIGDSGGVQFIVSELVEGETLGTRIAQGKLAFAEAVDIAIQAASALTAAHAAGIVHRDIKPDNVMIRHDGVVKVLDFGLAKARGFTTLNGGDFDALTLDSGSTSPGLIVGTPQYMSPEQARGKELDGRTDIFSLGIIIFEMVTRHSPFAGCSFADTMAAILTKEPRRLDEFVEDAPPRLIALIDKCLKKQRDERFSSMAEVETELKLLRGELVDSPRATVEVDPVKSDRTQIRPTDAHSIRRFVSDTFRKPSPIAAVIILIAAGLLIGGWWVWDRISLRIPSPSTSLMRTVPITSWSSTTAEGIMSAAFSPDERLVAYEVRGGDSTDIWVKPILGGDPVQVTREGGVNLHPIWSPDGDQLAFFSYRGDRRGIWRVPFTGGSMSPVVGGFPSTALPIAWTRSGAIYFVADSGNARELHRYLLASGESERISGLADVSDKATAFRLSPDEGSVAYSTKSEAGWELRVRVLSTGSDTAIAQTPDQINHFAWHPNGKRLFASFSVEGTLQVFEADVDGVRANQVSNGDMNYVVHDVSKSGSVLYSSLSETSDLWRLNTSEPVESVVSNAVSSEFWPDVNRDGTIVFQSVSRVERPERAVLLVTSATHRSPSNISASGFAPSWSNSGEWLAFFRRDDTGLSVWKSRADGIDPIKMTDAEVAGPAYLRAPYLKFADDLVWSPDDSLLAFAIIFEGKEKLWLADASDPTKGRLLNPSPIPVESESDPIWQPDGTIIYTASYFSSSNNRAYRIRSFNSRSGENKVLFESEEPLKLLGNKGSERSLIFARRTGGKPALSLPAPPSIDIYRLSVSNGEVTRFHSLKNAFFANIHLADDGNSLAYVSRTQDLTTISILSMNGDRAKDLLVINDPKVMVSSIALSPNAEFIVYGKQTRTNQLSMLTQ